MRPPKESRSALRYPLDVVLGSEAQVRVIRALIHQAAAPLGVSEVASFAGVTPTGARRALARLETAAFVERFGSGHSVRYRVRDEAVARSSLAMAFEAEREYYEELIGGIRQAVSFPEVDAAWFKPLPLDVTSAIQTIVVVDASNLSWVRDEVRSRLAATERRFDVIVEVAVHTHADAPEFGSADVALWGVVKPVAPRQSTPKTHAQAEARSLQLAQGVAELIRRDPSLARRAEQYLDRLISEGQGTATADLAEWRQILQTYSAARLSDLLTSGSSRGERLRSSAPFMAVLTAQERDHVLGRLGEPE